MEYREKMGNGGYAGKSFNGGKVPVCTAALVCLNAGIFVAGLIAPELGRWMEAKGCFSAVYLLYEKGGLYRLVTAAFCMPTSSICSITCCFCIAAGILWSGVLERCGF